MKQVAWIAALRLAHKHLRCFRDRLPLIFSRDKYAAKTGSAVEASSLCCEGFGCFSIDPLRVTVPREGSVDLPIHGGGVAGGSDFLCPADVFLARSGAAARALREGLHDAV